MQDWSTLGERFKHALLLGNGASINVWRDFAYPSLFEKAKLPEDDHDLFAALGTRDFERVLESLRVARIVCRQEGHASASINNRYRSIRRALVNAVASTHVEWVRVPSSTDQVINQTVRSHSFVFSTNYDLLLYWGLMDRPGRLLDFFWGPGNSFDFTDVGVRGNATAILFLHGALHLYRHPDGTTRKRVAADQNLISAFSAAQDVPVIVSEGNSAEKLAAIRRNDYLSFARRVFADQCRSLVIFGHRLADSDAHIRQVIRENCVELAVSLLPASELQIIQRKATLVQRFPSTRLYFYDATTHPLGNSNLRIEP